MGRVTLLRRLRNLAHPGGTALGKRYGTRPLWRLRDSTRGGHNAQNEGTPDTGAVIRDAHDPFYEQLFDFCLHRSRAQSVDAERQPASLPHERGREGGERELSSLHRLLRGNLYDRRRCRPAGEVLYPARLVCAQLLPCACAAERNGRRGIPGEQRVDRYCRRQHDTPDDPAAERRPVGLLSAGAGLCGTSAGRLFFGPQVVFHLRRVLSDRLRRRRRHPAAMGRRESPVRDQPSLFRFFHRCSRACGRGRILLPP